MEEGQHHGHGALRSRAVAGNAQGRPAEEVIVVDEGAGGGDHGVPEQREKPANSQACCICHEPWASSGGHRVCCIPCGHVYGRSCLETWLVRSGGTVAKCLWCSRLFKRKDMINLFGITEHLLDDDDGQHEEQVGAAGEEEEEAAMEEEAARQQVRAMGDEAAAAQQLALAPAGDVAAAMGNDAAALQLALVAPADDDVAAMDRTAAVCRGASVTWSDAAQACRGASVSWVNAAESCRAASVAWSNAAEAWRKRAAAARRNRAAAACDREAIMAFLVVILLISCGLLRLIW